MKKKCLIIVLLTVATCMLLFGGCSLEKRHQREHWKSLKYDMKELHTEIDYYFFDYDPLNAWRN